MWPFRRRATELIDSVRLGELSDDVHDYPVLTVGQSRLSDSFAALGFGEDDDPLFTWASVTPIMDPGMGVIADVHLRVDDRTIGYLRPPALDFVVALVSRHKAHSLEVPVMIVWTPAGPEVRAHTCLLPRKSMD